MDSYAAAAGHPAQPFVYVGQMRSHPEAGGNACVSQDAKLRIKNKGECV